jgi:hypothetical protein
MPRPYTLLWFWQEFVSGSCVSATFLVFFAGLAWTGLGSLGEIRCCNIETVHIKRYKANDKKTEPPDSELITYTALLLQDVQKYPPARRVPQLI